MKEMIENAHGGVKVGSWLDLNHIDLFFSKSIISFPFRSASWIFFRISSSMRLMVQVILRLDSEKNKFISMARFY